MKRPLNVFHRTSLVVHALTLLGRIPLVCAMFYMEHCRVGTNTSDYYQVRSRF